MSGKGGVGKSSITSLLALQLSRQGHKVGIIDADITGPSIPKIFGLQQRLKTAEGKMLPAETPGGIMIVSINLLLDEEDDPVLWKGPKAGGAVKQFWKDVDWGELDYLLVDMPPGTSDVPLTVLKSIPVDGIIVVTSPQELALMVVKKAVKMAYRLRVPIVGLVENMSYLRCSHCQEKLEVFGPSRAEESAEIMGVPLLGKIPIDTDFTRFSDQGKVEEYQGKIEIKLNF
ncbi:Mrp/NBP35 family ATP-binding protein [Candidatus Contubernalis alkalaceticus]|nr:Mrp/NBP35 family ATP-binding protein [Candidatus Contubernalis alkalaceticus]